MHDMSLAIRRDPAAWPETDGRAMLDLSRTGLERSDARRSGEPGRPQVSETEPGAVCETDSVGPRRFPAVLQAQDVQRRVPANLALRQEHHRIDDISRRPLPLQGRRHPRLGHNRPTSGCAQARYCSRCSTPGGVIVGVTERHRRPGLPVCGCSTSGRVIVGVTDHRYHSGPRRRPLLNARGRHRLGHAGYSFLAINLGSAQRPRASSSGSLPWGGVRPSHGRGLLNARGRHRRVHVSSS